MKMAEPKKINVALIGYKFMGRAHSHAYKDRHMFFETDAIPVMKVIFGRNEEAVKKVDSQFGWERYETSWEKTIKREDKD